MVDYYVLHNILQAGIVIDMKQLSSANNARDYQKSSFCGEGGCVGVARTAEGVSVVDLKQSKLKSLEFTQAEWQAFVAGVKNGEFDLN